MRECNGICAEHHFEIRCFECTREHRRCDWQHGLEWSQRRVGETVRVGMIDVVLKDEAHLRVKDGAVLGHLGFIEFGDLAQIIIDKCEHFQGVIPTQHWLTQRMDEMEKVRNFIAHNRMLLPSEFQRRYMYIADWNRVIGV